ncbi:hypothetical protein F1C16_04355 [Hymenobacter sp. NBH84]|uniref:hypothetical protein n=1 Tax=Hymenobacter sp. NBH84 TaxID=2596915 RepID=UPI001624B1EC|nr:hypothetical protein [Hymenobacter sp. NBH84]QNE38838.1 hypothetical protein F1C16_04355 [Hymenobacter sp. NBH84]
MKKVLFLLALAAASLSASAQTKTTTATTQAAPAGYQSMMAATIQELMQTGDPAALKASAAKLERAATVAPTDWLPRYYQAYALTTCANTGPLKETDQVLDQAEAALAQARKLGGDESELLTLQARIDQSRIRVDFMGRGQEYAGRATEAANRARALNPANPRPYLILANNVYHTPAAYGGGAAAAKSLFEQAKVKFDAFQPASVLAPNWGKNQVLDFLKSSGAAIN